MDAKRPSPVEWLVQHISARTVDEAECVLSVLLAIALAHAIGVTHVSWAAFAGYAVMRGHVAETLLRSVLRVIGTLAGGCLALATAPIAARWSGVAAAAVLIVGTLSLYGAIAGRRAYAWLFFGLTFAMVVFDAIEHPGVALDDLVRTRMLETLAGTAACVTVSLASTLTLRRRWPTARTATAGAMTWHPHALRHAAQGGVSLLVLALLGGWLPVPGLAQGAVTVMATMLVPVAGIGASGFVPVTQRMVQRFYGCAAGALAAGAVLLLAQGSAAIAIAGTAAGVALGRHVENGAHARRYAGTQFVLALLTVLVPDRFDATITAAPGWERLAGVLIGMAVLEPVLLAWHLLAPRVARGREASPGSLDA